MNFYTFLNSTYITSMTQKVKKYERNSLEASNIGHVWSCVVEETGAPVANHIS